MMMFFTSDLHLGHANILKFCHRPYNSVKEMDDDIIEKWNSVVNEKDTVYIIGDFSFKDPVIYLPRLKGKKRLITGGHDYKWKRRFREFDHVDKMEIIHIQHPKNTMVLSHCCFRVWERSHYNSWHLFGHSHGTLPPIGKSWDVGIDANNYGPPLSEPQIVEIMEKRPDNPNLIRKTRDETR